MCVLVHAAIARYVFDVLRTYDVWIDMRAIGYRRAGPINDSSALVDLDLPVPTVDGRDLLVEVKAVAVNPVDCKVRASADRTAAAPKMAGHTMLGWDATGIVRATGSAATRFAVGDEVFYAGSIARSGAGMEFHVVDERIVGSKPRSLDWAQAAALPLTSLTAWEALFDRLDVRKPVPGGSRSILVIGGAGGVGSVAIQLARKVGGLTVVTTASRDRSRSWVRRLGADHVLDHSAGVAAEFARSGLEAPSYVFSTTSTDKHYVDVAEVIAPQGRLVLIDDPPHFDAMVFKRKSVSIHHELMFTRSLFATADMGEQGAILDSVAELVDDGRVLTTLGTRLSPINAENMRRAHAEIETGATVGKIVLDGGFR